MTCYVTPDVRIGARHIAKSWKIDLGNLVRAVFAVKSESTLQCFEDPSETSGGDFITFMYSENDSSENWRPHDYRFTTKDPVQERPGDERTAFARP